MAHQLIRRMGLVTRHWGKWEGKDFGINGPVASVVVSCMYLHLEDSSIKEAGDASSQSTQQFSLLVAPPLSVQGSVCVFVTVEDEP